MVAQHFDDVLCVSVRGRFSRVKAVDKWDYEISCNGVGLETYSKSFRMDAILKQ